MELSADEVLLASVSMTLLVSMMLCKPKDVENPLETLRLKPSDFAGTSDVQD